MKIQLALITIILGLHSYAQSDIEKQTKPILEEGIRLYKSEMASWYGTDIFLEKYKERDKIGGYLSYTEKDNSTCIFFSKGDNPKVIGTMTFDKTFNVHNATTELTERDFNKTELELYTIRTKALQTINSDTIFKMYKKTNLNLIPLLSNGEKKVYVLTGPKENGIMIFGNDYLLTFDRKNNLINRKKLHQNIIWTNYSQKMDDGSIIVGGSHTHLPQTGDFITATDICTLMLYEKDANWENYYVSSQKYMSIWNCLTNELKAVPMETYTKNAAEKH
jgi:hypothetical protein